MRFGIKTPLLAGLGLMALALVLLARTPVDGSWAVDVLPAHARRSASAPGSRSTRCCSRR